jgi:peptidoglycan/xylan/chitin deacetylase (PgdA/CDA1 family)
MIKGKFAIIAYHRVRPVSYLNDNNLMNGVYISQEAFYKQIKWLKNRFEIVSLNDIIDNINKKQIWHNKKLAITFDDGWKDNYEYAYPILKEFNTPATIFLIGDYVGTDVPNFWDMCFEAITDKKALPNEIFKDQKIIDFIETNKNKMSKIELSRQVINKLRLLSYEEIQPIFSKLRKYYSENLNRNSLREKYKMLSIKDIELMDTDLITYGFHTKSHYMLTKLPKHLLRQELLPKIVDDHENKIKFNNFFCYPDGNHNEKVINILKDLGYIGATCLEPGVNSVIEDQYRLKRINIHQGNSSSIPLFSLAIVRACLKQRQND